MTMWNFFGIALLAAGYIASIYSWPRIRIWIKGISAEAADLRQRAARLEAKLRSL
jgi:hypothetical protein